MEGETVAEDTHSEFRNSAYVEYLDEIVNLVCQTSQSLFSEEEWEAVNRFHSISHHTSKYIFTKLSLRRGPWVRSDKLIRSFSKSSSLELLEAYESIKILADSGAITILRNVAKKHNLEWITAMSSCMSMDDLKRLSKKLSQTTSQMNKLGVIDRIINTILCSKNLFGGPLDVNKLLHSSFESTNEKFVQNQTFQIEIIKPNTEMLNMIRRFERLIQLRSGDSAAMSTNSWTIRRPLGFKAALLVKFRKVRYPSYDLCDLGSTSLFSNRKDFLQWEAAVELRSAWEEIPGLCHESSVFLFEQRKDLLTQVLGAVTAFDPICVGPADDCANVTVIPVPSVTIRRLLSKYMVRPKQSPTAASKSSLLAAAATPSSPQTDPWTPGIRLCISAAICLTALLDSKGETSEERRALEILGDADAGSVLVSLVWLGLNDIESIRDHLSYAMSVQLLRLLLRSPFTPRRRQRWLDRLCIDLSHLGRFSEAMDEAVAGRARAKALGQMQDVATLDRRTASLSSKTSGEAPQDPLPALQELVEEIISLDEGAEGSKVGGNSSMTGNIVRASEVEVLWSCSACTLLNEQKAFRCVLCETARTPECLPPLPRKTGTDPVSTQALPSSKKSDQLTVPSSSPSVESSLLLADAAGDTEEGEGGLWSLLGLRADSMSPQQRWAIPTVCVTGRRLNPKKPGKSRFIGLSDTEVSVEELVMEAMFAGEGELQRSHGEDLSAPSTDTAANKRDPIFSPASSELQQMWAGGGWRGWHCEGSPLRSLFGLLMWEELFASVSTEDREREELRSHPYRSCPVFLSPYQDAPLDLGYTGLFFLRRKERIDKRLQALYEMSGEEVLTVVGTSYRSHYRQKCRGLQWSHPMRLLQAIAVCVGGRHLSVIFRLFCVDFRYFCGGAPDLLMIRARKRRELVCGHTADPETQSDRVSEVLDLDWWLGAGWEGLGRDDREARDYDDLLGPGAGQWREEVNMDKTTEKRALDVNEVEGEVEAMDVENEASGFVDRISEEAPQAVSEELQSGTEPTDAAMDGAEAPAPLPEKPVKRDAFLCEERDLQLPVALAGATAGEEFEYECVIVEVKGPSDSLSPKQVLWLHFLHENGVPAAVCCVREPEIEDNNPVKKKRKSRKPTPEKLPYIRLQY